ncbi:MAG: ATPase [Pseudomonadota bacterium]
MPKFADLPSADDFRNSDRKSIALIGMSGVGKTHIARMLRAGGDWFHYSVDYRIGTRYMGEHIVDNFKREAMKSPLLRDLLLTDSIYIASNIAFENLKPLSTYLGKPGDAEQGGIPFEEYVTRQRQHRAAEIAAMLDTALFRQKALEIYGYDHFICDTSGSICEVVTPESADDPVLRTLVEQSVPIYVRATQADVDQLCARFDLDPKPIYFDEAFLRTLWTEYLSETGQSADAVDPDSFMRWSFRRQIDHRRTRYQAIADGWGVTIEKSELETVATETDFVDLIARVLDEAL